MADAILTRLSLSRCNQLTNTQQLSPIRYGNINLSNKGLSSLQTNDFAGLSNLRQLVLNNNRLTSLPSGIFDDLISIYSLCLHNNQLTNLPLNLLAHRTKLRYLYFYKNKLGTFPEGIFNGATNLFKLSISQNQLTELPSNTFDRPGNLNRLTLSWNYLTDENPPPSRFSGLTNLTYLSFRRDRFVHPNEDLLPSNAYYRLWNVLTNQNGLTTNTTEVYFSLQQQFSCTSPNIEVDEDELSVVMNINIDSTQKVTATSA